MTNIKRVTFFLRHSVVQIQSGSFACTVLVPCTRVLGCYWAIFVILWGCICGLKWHTSWYFLLPRFSANEKVIDQTNWQMKCFIENCLLFVNNDWVILCCLPQTKWKLLASAGYY